MSARIVARKPPKEVLEELGYSFEIIWERAC
jgi:hypothetical protein